MELCTILSLFGSKAHPPQKICFQWWLRVDAGSRIPTLQEEEPKYLDVGTKQTWNGDGINSYISGLDKSFGLCPEGQLQPGEAASKPWHSFLNWEFEINPHFPCCAAFFIENLKQNLLFPLVPPSRSPEILTNMVQVGISLHSAGIHLSQQQLLLLTRIKTGKEFRSGIFDSIHWKSSFQDSKQRKFSFQSSPKKPKKKSSFTL